ncbi:MAG: hypothetical protein HY944_00980 [Gemmatimonadetes bacterium]|nr:hypothetical protein [Gemmatimonadota bacterium]
MSIGRFAAGRFAAGVDLVGFFAAGFFAAGFFAAGFFAAGFFVAARCFGAISSSPGYRQSKSPIPIVNPNRESPSELPLPNRS